MLRDYVEIFAWSYEDMPGIDTDIVVHRLPMKEGYSPIMHKVHRMRPEMFEKIKVEVIKQFNAGFLAFTSYLQWVANVIPVPKKDGKVRMCVDYIDLNRESPKDDFPLPHIDVLVTTTLSTKCFPSRTVSPVIIKSRWHLKTWRRILLSHSGAISATRLCLLG